MIQNQILVRIKVVISSLAAFTAAQKVLAVLGVAVLVLGGSAFYRWASAPTYAPLFTGVSGSDAQAIVEQLTADGVDFQLEDGGTTVLVPREAVNAQRLKAAAAGLPSDTSTGYALLGKEGVTASQFQQQITYQRAVEGELAATIEAIDGVNTAVVHLAIPEQTVFSDEAGTTTASVLIDSAPGASLTAEQVQSVVHLVSSSVPGLDVDQVTVSSSDGTLLSAAGEGLAGGGGGRDGQTTEYERRTQRSVQAMLDRVVGVGNAVATVTAELNFDETQRTSETFTAQDGVPPLSETNSTENYVGDQAGVGGALGNNGVLGMDQQEVAKTIQQQGGYTKESNTRNNAVNKVTEQTTDAPGTVRRQSIAVVVDTSAAASAGVPELTQMVTAAAGVDAARGDTLAVSQVAFDTSAADAAAAQLAAAQKADALAARNALITQAAIAAAVLLLAIVLLIAWRRAAKKRRRQVVDIGELDAMYRRDDVITQDGFQAGPGGMALAGQNGPQLVSAGPNPAALRRAEVGDLVDQQPTEVAEVLRGWLTDKGK